MFKIIISMVVICGTVLYPVLMYVTLRSYSPRLIAILIGGVALLSAFSKDKGQHTYQLTIPIVAIMMICLVSVIMNQPAVMLYLPSLISANFLVSFGYTLLRPPSMVEVFARRMTDMVLVEEQLHYCRQVTLIWTLFFAVNGAVAIFTACCTSLEMWSLYNGLIAYGVMGLLFLTELCYRYWRFRRYLGQPTDVFFKRFFPPRDI